MMRAKVAPIVAWAALATATAVTASAAKSPVLPFIENDFEKAMAAAKSADRPVFVEVWAPW